MAGAPEEAYACPSFEERAMTLASGNILLLFGVAIGAASLGVSSANATLTISNAATKNVACSAGVCAATAKNAVLNAGDLTGMIASSDVTVRSNNKAKDIELKVALSWASSSRLTLDAYQSVTFDKPLTVAGSGALTLTTNDGGSGGALSFLSPGRAIFWDLSSSLVIDGASHTLVGDIATLASDIASDPSGHYALANNYDARVDGTYASPPIPTTFTGTFDGLGNVISHLTIDDASSASVGLFAEIGVAGTVRDLSLRGANVEGGMQAAVGSLVGRTEGTIERVSVTGTVGAPAGNNSAVGGLAGFSPQGAIVRSSAASKATGALAGGLVGNDRGAAIMESFATGRVTGVFYAGGLAGTIDAGIATNSYATDNVQASSSGDVGGLAGVIDQTSTVTGSYSAGNVKGGTRHLTRGGFVGAISFNNTFSDNYWDKTAGGHRGVGNAVSVAGIIGLTDDELKSGLPAGFDPTIWAQSATVNGGLPYLIANPPTP
jgi:hypothetical protein